MRGLYFEEFEVGRVYKHPFTRTVTESDNVLFTSLTMNPQPLHLDAEFAAQTEFRKPLVNSMFTVALVVGLSVPELTLGTTIANLGFGAIEFPAPVFAGDTVRVTTEITQARLSASRPDAGIVTFQHVAHNQRDEVVCRASRAAFMRCRPADD